MIAILLLAAGASRRMGDRDKLLEEIDGLPLLRRQAARAVSAGCGPVLVTLPEDSPRADSLRGLDVTQVPVPEAAEGMGASIRSGVAALPKGVTGVMILPADMPDITTADLTRMAEAFATAPGPRPILRGASAGLPGHPVLFPDDLFAELRALQGDTGAREILKGNTVRLTLVALPGRHALTDLDTPEAWAEWRGSAMDPGNAGSDQ
ncbi:NTP transferase domain-containing protein [Pseudooceanicola sp. HF7]|uniref:nucleotidyltransferase family protein n=1 Tax=Pseudooceanicola sp. HF7 TaxID=2721560 RepID=UPI0014303B13|nr:nucleotidyltransferase family protein [Pseudooceanicola sp. HF7]NIZ10350.1 nucleotidyltransferase family protein [Pseudooceanicola sp. HF7]